MRGQVSVVCCERERAISSAHSEHERRICSAHSEHEKARPICSKHVRYLKFVPCLSGNRLYGKVTYFNDYSPLVEVASTVCIVFSLAQASFPRYA